MNPAPAIGTTAIRMRWKVRALWGSTMAAFSVTALCLFSRYGSDSPRALPAVVPLVLGYLVSFFWPRCPYCATRVIRTKLDWLSPPLECPSCNQTYDGPYRSEDELAQRDHEEARRLLAERGVVVPDDPPPPGSSSRSA
jgi:hypothetical protein